MRSLLYNPTMKPPSLAAALILLLAGCHHSEPLAEIGVPTPALASGWMQFRDEPGGFEVQTPEGWGISNEPEVISQGKIDHLINSSMLLIDAQAAQAGDLVTFTISRLADQELFGERNNLDELSKKAMQVTAVTIPDVQHRRIQLPVGPAEHLWGTLFQTGDDGAKRKIVSNMVVIATPLRLYTVSYGYPSDKESLYRSKLEKILQTVRLRHPKKNGEVLVPTSAPRNVSRNTLHNSGPSTAPQPPMPPTNPWGNQAPPVQQPSYQPPQPPQQPTEPAPSATGDAVPNPPTPNNSPQNAPPSNEAPGPSTP